MAVCLASLPGCSKVVVVPVFVGWGGQVVGAGGGPQTRVNSSVQALSLAMAEHGSELLEFVHAAAR